MSECCENPRCCRLYFYRFMKWIGHQFRFIVCVGIIATWSWWFYYDFINTSQTRMCENESCTMIQTLIIKNLPFEKTYPNSYKDAYDFFNKQLGIILSVLSIFLMVFGIAPPLIINYFQHQNIKDEGNAIKKENKKMREEMENQKVQFEITNKAIKDEISAQEIKIFFGSAMLFQKIAEESKDEINAWMYYIHAIRQYSECFKNTPDAPQYGTFKICFEDMEKKFGNNPPDKLRDKEIMKSNIKSLHEVLKNKHVNNTQIKNKIELWINSLNEKIGEKS